MVWRNWIAAFLALLVLSALGSLVTNRESVAPVPSGVSTAATESSSSQTTESPSSNSSPTVAPSPSETPSSEPSPENSPSDSTSPTPAPSPTEIVESAALEALASLPIKGRAPQTGYSRELFSDGWGEYLGCDWRNRILARDLTTLTFRDSCIVASGLLLDPYSGKEIEFVRGVDTSFMVQIDHVVAVSDAWQKGAQQLNAQQRYTFYNDPLNLLAVSGSLNQQKGDSDAASWLPPNKAFRCQYVARQIAVKAKYELWITQAEHDAMLRVLQACPGEPLPGSG